ncbi:hypothetical protein FLAPXU55_03014 [Flavobacterium panici]|uniref:Secretion system C-terminal sorting domain-containing protein n=2 Tax=Flavobacteriaceae TaxID=49546 RepID=A0A9N8J2V6_9FLAO|nr:hypothetical protein FLAPXU55_03014 [Flavobacterium panici]
MAFIPFKGISQNTPVNDTMETIIPSGSNATGSSGSVTYSIGQVFYTYIGTGYNVAQGIQQQESDETLDNPEVEVPEVSILVFPNPAADFVNVSLKAPELESKDRLYRLYDIQGRLLKQNKINQTETQVSLNNLTPSLYILVVYVDGKILESFKILKK